MFGVLLTKHIRLLLTACICLLVACNGANNTKNSIKSEVVEKILDETESKTDSLGADVALRFLDSSLVGMSLSDVDKYNVLVVRYNLHQDFLHDYEAAVLYADSMIDAAGKVGESYDTAFLFRAYLSKANSLYDAEHFNDAFRYFEKAREFVTAINEPCTEFPFIFRIAMSLYREEIYIQSARMFAQAYQTSLECGSPTQGKFHRQQEGLSNIGLAYSKAGMPDSAIYYFDSSLALTAKTSQLFPDETAKWLEAESVVLGNKGAALRQMGDYDASEACFRKSIAISKKSGRNELDRQYNMLKLADLYLHKKDVGSAGEVLRECEQLHSERKGARKVWDNVEYEYRASRILHRYYSMTGESAKAVWYMGAHDSLKTVRRSHIRKMQKNDLIKGIGEFSRSQSLLSLQKDLKIRKQQNIILFLTIVLCVGGLVLIFYLLKQYKRKYRHLEAAHEKVTQESAEKEAVLKRKMREDELNFISLIENTDDFLWSVSKDFNLLAFNNAYREYIYRIFGEYPEIGKREIAWSKSIEAFSKVTDGYKEVLRTGDPVLIGGQGHPIDGIAPEIEIRLKPITDENGNIAGVSCFRRDVTETKRLIQNLKLGNERLKNIAWVQSHKLRGPLSTILGVCYFITEEGISDEHKEDLLKSLKEKAEEMDRIIHEIVYLTE